MFRCVTLQAAGQFAAFDKTVGPLSPKWRIWHVSAFWHRDCYTMTERHSEEVSSLRNGAKRDKSSFAVPI